MIGKMSQSEELPPTDELQEVEENEPDININTEADSPPVAVIEEEGTGVDDELNDEANVEGAILSSVQIAPTDNTNPVSVSQNDPMLFVQLGDRVVYDSTKYGRTIGTVYYRSSERISVKPDGVSNMLHSFELDDNDEEEIYKEEYGVSSVYVIEKRKFESFVEQQDFRINQLIDTFDSTGDIFKSYKITSVDKENDYIKIQDLDDEDDVRDLEFNFIGIESDEPFQIISIRQLVAQEEGKTEITPVEGEDATKVSEEEEEEADEDEVEMVGFIEIVRPKIFREAAAYEQRNPDNLQKIDALNDFINSLDSTLQKDAKALRAVRVLIETLFNLKQATIAYNDDGTIRGQKEISVSTLSELISKVPVPLGRPVLDVRKKEYIVGANEEDGADEGEEKTDEIFFEDFQRELDAIIQNKSTLVSGAMSGATTGQIVREWNDQKTFLKQYLSPWLPNEIAEPVWKSISDSDFFRTEPPSVTTNEDGKEILDNTVSGYIQAEFSDVPPVMYKVPFGLERALTTTYRKGSDRRKQVLIQEDEANLNSYLMFPIKTVNNLGSTRSSSIAIDSGRAQMEKKTMKMILEEIGCPKEVGTSNDLVLLDVVNNTLGNIPLADYLEGISVPSLGLGDTFATLEQYGINNLELTPDIVNVLLGKIELYQSQLLSTLSKLRQIIETEPGKEPELNPLLEAPTILEEIRSQPTLVEDLQEFERINPTLAQSDIGKVAYLMMKHPDDFQVAAGKNSVLIAKALLNANNAEYIQTLKVANLLRYNQLNAGHKPERNTCKHVADLVAVKRIYDDTERFQKFIDYFRLYQGERANNWIDCNVCKNHLICLHERLQMHAFLNPKEKHTIEKEIILKFAGGVFQGKYICRNCGQAIKDLDFDNNIEFDDNGRPKSGNAILEDEDALFEERMDLLVSVPIEPSEKKELSLNDDETKCYNIIREIAERVGVSLDKSGYRNVIDKTIAWVNKFPKRDDYVEQKKKRPTLPDYEVAMSRNIITAAATFLLLEIQTKIPSYVVRYALIGCTSPGFDGYPLVNDLHNKQGIEYIACAVSSIRRNEAPWNQTGFQKMADDTKRQQGIMMYINNILKEVISDDVIQAHLSEKRQYLEEIKGNDTDKSRPRDEIPKSFLPEQVIITPEEAAKNAINAEVAANMGERGQLAVIKLWIRQAHALAKKTASLVRGSPLVETTCCLANIEQPGTFWRSASDLPTLNKRRLVPNQQGSFLITTFNPRQAGSDVAEPDKELYYRIFLKCCFQGPRIGYTHEPGLTNVCPWCGFQFPTMPAIMDTDTEGKTSLASQNIKTGTEEFTQLLDTIHLVNKVEPPATKSISSVTDIMQEFGTVTPPPIQDWKEILAETTTKFLALPPDADKGDIALASGVISDATSASERIIEERLTAEAFQAILEEIVKLSWVNFFQVLQMYFITPFKRIITNFNSDSLFVPTELQQDLSELHVEEDVKPILDNDLSLLTLKQDDIKKPSLNFARSKISYFLKQVSALLPYKNKIRPIVVPGRENTLVYIQRALLYGPIATLINPSEIPAGTEITSPIKSIGDPSMRFILEIIALTLNKYKKERVSFNDKEIKEMIAIRDEKERVNVINEFNKLTDEERAIELMNKRLGLGKWAVGGTKLIYAYDKDYYDLERQKRLAAGITEFPGSGSGELSAPTGADLDMFGFKVHSDAEFEKEGGYDQNQHADDDYE